MTVKTALLRATMVPLEPYIEKIRIKQHTFQIHILYSFFFIYLPHQWQSGFALKAGRREAQGSVSDLAC